ncbi:MAG: hypothetical protein IJV91_05810, partial [Kiritimatiellae bacterium]|nr:hypothetical protein [Kiritimatiellia bacterium]
HRPLSTSAEVETPMTQTGDRSILQLHEDKGGIRPPARKRLTESDKISKYNSTTLFVVPFYSLS